MTTMELLPKRSLLNPFFETYKLQSTSLSFETVSFPEPPLTLTKFEQLLEKQLDSKSTLNSISYAISVSKLAFHNLLILNKDVICETETERIVYFDHQMNLIFMTLQGYVESVFPMNISLQHDLNLSSWKSSSFFSFPVLKLCFKWVLTTNGLNTLTVYDAQTQLCLFHYVHSSPFVVVHGAFLSNHQLFQVLVYQLKPLSSSSSSSSSLSSSKPSSTVAFDYFLWTFKCDSLPNNEDEFQPHLISFLGDSSMTPFHATCVDDLWHLLLPSYFQWADSSSLSSSSCSSSIGSSFSPLDTLTVIFESWHQTSTHVTLQFRLLSSNNTPTLGTHATTTTDPTSRSSLDLQTDLKVICMNTQCQFVYQDQCVYETQVFASITSFEWTFQSNQLTLTLEKQEPMSWPTWSHVPLTSWKGVPGLDMEDIDLNDPSNSITPSTPSSELVWIAFASSSSSLLSFSKFTNDKLPSIPFSGDIAKINTLGYRYLMPTSKASSICLHYDVDGLVFDLKSKANTRVLDHVQTFPALGYIVSSKREARFGFVTSTHAIIMESERHIYFYKVNEKEVIGQQYLMVVKGEVLGYAVSYLDTISSSSSSSVNECHDHVRKETLIVLTTHAIYRIVLL